jgi:hypothetical protein
VIVCEVKAFLYGYESDLKCRAVIFIRRLYEFLFVLPCEEMPVAKAVGMLCVVVPVDTIVGGEKYTDDQIECEKAGGYIVRQA